MAIPVLIIGESGQGKSSAMQNLNKDECMLIQSVRKALPFKNDWAEYDSATKKGNVVVSDSPETVCEAIRHFSNPDLRKKTIIIDDFQYFLANEFMRRSSEKGFEKFTDIAKHTWNMIIAAQAIRSDVIIYFLSHSQTDDRGVTKCKTIGKLLDEKITLEGLFTIVLKAVRRDGKNYFTTQNDGADTIKTPIGMFDSDLIDNDLNFVNKSIRNYYSLGN